MTDKLAVVILAAGKGTRMSMDVPKPLVPACGKSLVDFSLIAAKKCAVDLKLEPHFKVVTGHGKEEVESYLESQKDKENISYVWQKEQNGTGDAVRCYLDQEDDLEAYKYSLVMCADTPLLRSEDLVRLYNKVTQTDSDAVVATFKVNNPHGYGRIVKDGEAFKIVEEKDADQGQKLINEVNSGLYIFKTSYLKKHISSLDTNNASGELYLTDLFQSSRKVEKECFEHPENFLGVNDLFQLEVAQKELFQRKSRELTSRGVRFIDRQTNYIDWDVEVGKSTVIYPGVSLQGKTHIADHCTIENGSIIKNSKIASGCKIKAYSSIEDSIVGESCQVGPYARLRPGTTLDTGVKIGNFVETKKCHLESKVSVSHLSYVGDAEIGENTNIGCGFITCNYDGESKHLTKIGKNCFIGSDTQTIAPLELGDSVFVGSGSTLTHNIPSGGFAIARGKQVTKEKMAKRFLKGKWNLDKKN